MGVQCTERLMKRGFVCATAVPSRAQHIALLIRLPGSVGSMGLSWAHFSTPESSWDDEDNNPQAPEQPTSKGRWPATLMADIPATHTAQHSCTPGDGTKTLTQRSSNNSSTPRPIPTLHVILTPIRISPHCTHTYAHPPTPEVQREGSPFPLGCGQLGSRQPSFATNKGHEGQQPYGLTNQCNWGHALTCASNSQPTTLPKTTSHIYGAVQDMTHTLHSALLGLATQKDEAYLALQNQGSATLLSGQHMYASCCCQLGALNNRQCFSQNIEGGVLLGDVSSQRRAEHLPGKLQNCAPPAAVMTLWKQTWQGVD